MIGRWCTYAAVLYSTLGSVVYAVDGATRLLNAAWCGDRARVVDLIESEGISPSVQDGYGRTPLHISAYRGHLHIVKYLVEQQSVAVDVKNFGGERPLYYASLPGHIEIVKHLIERGKANVHAEIEGLFEEETPLFAAVHGGSLTVVRYLVERCNADKGIRVFMSKSPLVIAARKNDHQLVKYLIQKSGDNVDIDMLMYHGAMGCGMLNYLMKTYSISYNFRVHVDILQSAIRFHNWRIANYLMRKQNVRVNEGVLAEAACEASYALFTYCVQKYAPLRDIDAVLLCAAAQSGDCDKVKYLIEKHNCPVDVERVRTCETPLHSAMKVGALNIATYLVEQCGISTDTPDDNGRTPLYWAAYRGDIDSVKYLVGTCHARVDIQDRVGGGTPIVIAARKGYIDVVAYLAKQWNAPHDAQASWLHALERGHIHVAQYLERIYNIDAKADRSRERCNENPIFYMADIGPLSSVKYLIEQHGCNTAVRDRGGRTPLLRALRSKNDVVDYLLAHGADINACDNRGKGAVDASDENKHLLSIVLRYGAQIREQEYDMVNKTLSGILDAFHRGDMEHLLSSDTLWDESSEVFPDDITRKRVIRNNMIDRITIALGQGWIDAAKGIANNSSATVRGHGMIHAYTLQQQRSREDVSDFIRANSDEKTIQQDIFPVLGFQLRQGNIHPHVCRHLISLYPEHVASYRAPDTGNTLLHDAVCNRNITLVSYIDIAYHLWNKRGLPSYEDEDASRTPRCTYLRNYFTRTPATLGTQYGNPESKHMLRQYNTVSRITESKNGSRLPPEIARRIMHFAASNDNYNCTVLQQPDDAHNTSLSRQSGCCACM